MGQKIARFTQAIVAWAVGNLLWDGVTVASTFGGSFVITAFLGILLTAFSGISGPLLVLLLIGIFLLGLAVMGTVAQRFAVGRDAPRLAVGEQGTSVDRATVDEAPGFDPYTISSELAGVDLAGLSEPESFMMITLNVRNVSRYPVTITGVKGRIRCAGAECNMNATVEREPRPLSTSSYDRVPCTIRQPISGEMMHTVAVAADLVISLSGLQWIGSVALPQGSEPLESCYIHEDFVVKGPFQEKRDAGALFRLRTTFLSSEHYNSDGTPKRDEARQALSQTEEPKGINDERQQELLQNLRGYAIGEANVKILFANVKHRSLADTLISVFELAGWQTDLTNVPLESRQNKYLEGVDVAGYNKHLVEAIANFLTKAGVSGVRPTVGSHKIKPDNPKFPWVQQHVKITIGHQD